MKLKKTDLNLGIYYITILIQVLTINYESIGMISNLKYVSCIIGITYSFFLIYRRGNMRELKMKSETLRLLTVPLFFLIISLIKIQQTHDSSSRIVNELMFMILPILYSYGLINTLNYKQIEKAMFGTLLISLIGYFVNLKMSPDMFIDALASMDFNSSESLLESSQFSGIAVAVALFYLYYRKSKIGLFLSVAFVILTFKRLAILVIIILLFLPKIIDLTKQVRKKTFRFICAIVFIVGILYFQIMLPENKGIVYQYFGSGFDRFTMSRYWRFSLIYGQPSYINYGLGSTFDFLMKRYNFSLEMDISKLIIEVGYVAVFIFVYQYFYAVKKNLYCTILMGYMFLNMITSHSLASMFTWIIVFITIGTIQYIAPNGVKPSVDFRKSGG